MRIQYKTPSQIQLLKQAGKYHNELLVLIYDHAQEGVSLSSLDKIAADFLIKNKLKSAFKGFNNFPAYICLSVNNCLVHGIPNEYVLRKWDLLKIDIWVSYKWMITDAAVAKVIWWAHANKHASELIWATKWSLDASLEIIKPWVSLQEYWRYVQQYIDQKWFSIVKSLTGHWVWFSVHEDPRVANYADHRLKHIYFKPWMVLALEPITAIRSEDYIVDKNNWNLNTKYADLWCQREYTIVVTDTGYELLAGIDVI